MTLSFNSVEFRHIVAQNLCNTGILPEPAIPEELPWLTAFIEYIAASNSQDMANIRMSALTEFLEGLSQQIEQLPLNQSAENVAIVTVNEVNQLINKASSKANLNDANITRTTQSWLCYDNGLKASIKSVKEHIGYQTEALKEITKAVSDTNRATDL